MKSEEKMAIIEELNSGIKEAMLKKDSMLLDTLRMLKSKIMAVEARGNLPDGDVIKLFKTYYGNLEEALGHAEASNRAELIDKLKKEMEIVQRFLPKALSPDEVERAVKQAIEKTGATSKKDVGAVMKAIKEIDSRVEGKQAMELLNKLLG